MEDYAYPTIEDYEHAIQGRLSKAAAKVFTDARLTKVELVISKLDCTFKHCDNPNVCMKLNCCRYKHHQGMTHAEETCRK